MVNEVKCQHCDLTVPVTEEIRDGWVCGACKATDGRVLDNMRINCARNLNEFEAPKPLACAVVGGGPSLKQTYKQLHGVKMPIFAVNNTLKWLDRRKIRPSYYVMLDGNEKNAKFVEDAPDYPVYLISSSVHPSVLDNLGDAHNVQLWHSNVPRYVEEQKGVLNEFGSGGKLIGGGCTVGLRTMTIAFIMGFKEFHLYGMDSCFRKGDHHAYKQLHNDEVEVSEIEILGKKFTVSSWMYRQAVEFDTLWWKYFTSLGCRIYAYGDGLIPHIVNHYNKTQFHDG